MANENLQLRLPDRPRHPHRRDHGRHQHGGLRARAGDDSARREGGARGWPASWRALAVPEAEYLAWRTSVTAGQDIEARLADVQYEGLQRVNPEYLEQRAQVQAGRHRRHGRDQRRGAAHVGPAGIRVGRVPARPAIRRTRRWSGGRRKSAWARTTSSSTSACTARRAATSGSWSTASTRAPGSTRWAPNGATRCSSAISTTCSTSFYQPLDVAQRFFVEPQGCSGRARWEDVFFDNERLARYKFSDRGRQRRRRRQPRATTRRCASATCTRDARSSVETGLADPAGGRARRRRPDGVGDVRQSRHAVQPDARASRPRWSTRTSTIRSARTSTGSASNSASAWRCRCATTSSG